MTCTSLDTLQLENGVSRSRTLTYIAHTAAQLLQAGELETRLQRIEDALEGRRR